MSASASTRVLLVGGHGKVAMQLTPLLLGKSWHVTSVVRNHEHEDEILKTGEGKPGKVEVLIDSLDDVKSDEHVKGILDKVKPEIVVWSAGAGGKGGPSRTFAVDRDAAKHYISASLAQPSIRKFMMVSYINSRRKRPSWWSDSDWETSLAINNGALSNYHKAKVEADEFLTALAHKRREGGDTTFQAICIRPGTLKDEPATGKVNLGRTGPRGPVSREDVARVAFEVLQRDDTRGWIDFYGGDTEIKEAVDTYVRDGVDSFEGEDRERVFALAERSEGRL